MSGDHAVLSQEFPGGHQSNRRFFSVRRSDGYSQLAPLDKKNRVGRVTLYEGRLILFQVENLPTQPRSREKGLNIENRIATFGLRLGRVKPRRFFKFGDGGTCGPHGSQQTEFAWLEGPDCGQARSWRSFHTSERAAPPR